MSGWSFTSGVSGILPAGSVVPAGGRFVVAKEAVRFEATNRFAPNALYGGNLSNGGETVTLVDAAANVVDTVTYADLPPWPTSPDAGGPTLELRDLMSDNSVAENWGASTVTGGTPNAVNSLNGTAVAPVITDLAAAPARPAANESVVVSARLIRGSTATLSYKVMFGQDVAIPFLDDAASPGGAGDGVYAATLPGQPAGTLTRYRIDATSGGVQYSAPAEGDSVRYRGVVVPAAGTSQLPTVQWFMDDAVYNDILANHRQDDFQGEAVWAFDGNVVDGVLMNVRGGVSREAAKVNWKVEFPKGYTFDLGGRMPYPLDEFALQNFNHNFADVSWATVLSAGARGLGIQPVRTERNGAFWSLGRIMETQDGTWRDDQGVDDWAIYKGDGGRVGRLPSAQAYEDSLWLDKKTREDEDFTDVWNLTNAIDAPASAAQEAWIYQNVNVPEMVNYLAINSLIRHADSGWHNWYVARDTEGTQRWEMWFWDLDLTFTTPEKDGKGEYLTPDSNNRFHVAMLNYPSIREMYFRRLRTLADEFLTPGKMEAQWDAITARTLSDWNQDRARWGGYTPTSGRTAFLAGLADRRNVIANNTGAGKPVPASQSANASVVINELQYQPAGSGGEFIELTNPSSSSVDVSGWAIDAVDLTIQPGTVIPAGGSVVFVSADTAFRQAYPGANRLVGGQFTGSLDDAGETVTVRDGDRVVDTVTYSATAPWPAAAAGTGPSLELTSPTADNADPANWRATSTTGGTPGVGNTGAVVTPPVTPPAGSVFAADAFGRTASNGLGSAETGGAWTVSGTAANYSVTNGAARLSTAQGSSRTAFLNAVSSSDTDVQATASFTRPTSGSAYVGLIGRRVGSVDYRTRAVIGSTGTVQLQVQNTGTTLQSATIPGLTYNTGDSLVFRMQVTGTSPTTLRAKVWKAGTTEPAAWQITRTDTTAALQAAGSIGVHSYFSSGGTISPLIVTIDDLTAKPTGSVVTPPAGSVFAADAFGRTASNGLGSAETGGAWTVSGTAANYSVTNGAARLSTAQGSSRTAFLNAVSSSDTDVQATASFTRPTSGSAYVGLIGRRVGSVDYRTRAVIGSTGTVQLQVQNTGTTLQSATIPGLTYNTGDSLVFRMQVTGTSPTTLRAKVWKAGTTEPAAWQITRTDTTAALQAAGSIGVHSYFSSGGTISPLIVTIDDLTAKPAA